MAESEMLGLRIADPLLTRQAAVHYPCALLHVPPSPSAAQRSLFHPLNG